MLDPRLNCIPENVKTIHLMGICGTGMAALAGMLKKSGYTITGSDNNVYPPMSDFLYSLEITPFEGYAEDNLNHSPDLVIVGNVITRLNPEATGLLNKSIHYISFPQALAHFYISTKNSIVVAGTHGKTTTCSLLATSLYHLGLDPSFMIGGIVSEFQSNNRLGEGKYFVAEGDEYDTAFFDKESKFLHYLPKIVILTSIEFDHADIFDNIDQIKEAFRKFVSLIPPDGLLIANTDDNNVADVISHARCVVQSYGLSAENYWQLSEYKTGNNNSTFSVIRNSSTTEYVVPMSGRHNCLNALGVAAVLSHLVISSDDINSAFSLFKGVKRRQEVRGIVNNITVIDDFAHHPTAVRETLDGLKLAHGNKRLVAVFEPRTNSSRRSIFQKEYVTSFSSADLVFLREPIPLQNVPEEELFSSYKLAADIMQRFGIEALAFETTDAILDRLKGVLQEGDVVAILSNGGFDNIHERLLNQLK